MRSLLETISYFENLLLARLSWTLRIASEFFLRTKLFFLEFLFLLQCLIVCCYGNQWALSRILPASLLSQIHRLICYIFSLKDNTNHSPTT